MTTIDFADMKADLLRNPEVRAEYDALGALSPLDADTAPKGVDSN